MKYRTPSSAALVAVLVLLSAGVVSAKKPVPPPPTPADTGSIYYASWHVDADGVREWLAHSMNPDGSDKTTLAASGEGVPSSAPHWCAADAASERWFLEVRPVGAGTYLNAVPRHELFAVSETGVAHQLTDAVDISPDHIGPTYGPTGTQLVTWVPRPQWVDGDTRVSYAAKRWVADEDLVVEWGFYVLDVDPDALHAHTPARPTWIPVAVPLIVIEDIDPDDAIEYTGGHANVKNAWAPDGSAFVYLSCLLTGGLGQGPLMRADHDEATDTWSTTELASNTMVESWAPVPDRILVKQGGGLATLDPYDPTDVIALPIAGTSTNRLTTEIWDGCWSPSGTHIAYLVRAVTWKGVETFDVYRAAADGSDPVNLTSRLDADAWLIGWGGD